MNQWRPLVEALKNPEQWNLHATQGSEWKTCTLQASWAQRASGGLPLDVKGCDTCASIPVHFERICGGVCVCMRVIFILHRCTYTHTHIYIYIHIYIYVCVSVYASVYRLSTYLSTYPPIYLSIVYLSIYCCAVYRSIYLSTYLPIYLSIHLSIYLSNYLSIHLPNDVYVRCQAT